MSVLEKILSEIDCEVDKQKEICSDIVETSGWRVYQKAMERAEEIVRKHLPENDGWIPVEEGLPEESLDSVIGWDANRERCCFVQYYMGRWILGNGDEPVKIIAWRPTPTPYKLKEGDT